MTGCVDDNKRMGMKLEKKVVLCVGKRVPFAQMQKGLSPFNSVDMGVVVLESILKEGNIPKEEVDGVIAGEAFPSAPNTARVILNLVKLPDETPAITLNQNCVSSLESVVEAARRVLLGEGDLYIALGLESLTHMPYVIRNGKLNKKTATLEKLKKYLEENGGKLPEDVELVDILEEGLGDTRTSFAMAATAEIVAQNYGISRELSDEFAYQSFKRAYDATVEGKYDKYLIPISYNDHELKRDEAVLLREGIVKNPSRMQRAMLLFDNPQFKWEEFKKRYKEYLEKEQGPTVTIFNACPRSDGASGIVVTTPEKAKELGLEVLATLTGFRMKGVDPNVMGLGQAASTLGLLEDMGMDIKDVDQIEIHEAFAATAIGALMEIQNQTSWDWYKAFQEGKVNRYGGSIAIGHPFGATGIRLILNAIMDMEHHSEINKVVVTACAHGGVSGALMIERP